MNIRRAKVDTTGDLFAVPKPAPEIGRLQAIADMALKRARELKPIAPARLP